MFAHNFFVEHIYKQIINYQVIQEVKIKRFQQCPVQQKVMHVVYNNNKNDHLIMIFVTIEETVKHNRRKQKDKRSINDPFKYLFLNDLLFFLCAFFSF